VIAGGTGSLLNRADLTPYFEVNFHSVPEFPILVPDRSASLTGRRYSVNCRATLPTSKRLVLV
jgi:hypothetical protein